MRISLDLNGLDISLALRPDALHISESTGGGVVVPIHEIVPLLDGLKLAERLYEVSTPLCGLGAEPADLADQADQADLIGEHPTTEQRPVAQVEEPAPATTDHQSPTAPQPKREVTPAGKETPATLDVQPSLPVAPPKAGASPRSGSAPKPATETMAAPPPGKAVSPVRSAPIVTSITRPPKAEPRTTAAPEAEPPKPALRTTAAPKAEPPRTQTAGIPAPVAQEESAQGPEGETAAEKQSRSRRARRRRAREAAAAKAPVLAPPRPAPREQKSLGGARPREVHVVSRTHDTATFRIGPTVRVRRRHAEPDVSFPFGPPGPISPAATPIPPRGSVGVELPPAAPPAAAPPAAPPADTTPRPQRRVPALPRTAGSRTPPPLTEALAHFLTYNGPAPLDDLVRYVRTLRLWPAMNLRLSVTVALSKKSCGFIRRDDGTYTLESDTATP